MVTEKPTGEPLLGSTIIEALGLNTSGTFNAAAEKHPGIVDDKTIFDEKINLDENRHVSRVLEGVYHAEGGVNDKELCDTYGWLHLGPEKAVEKDNILERNYPRLILWTSMIMVTDPWKD